MKPIFSEIFSGIFFGEKMMLSEVVVKWQYLNSVNSFRKFQISNEIILITTGYTAVDVNPKPVKVEDIHKNCNGCHQT